MENKYWTEDDIKLAYKQAKEFASILETKYGKKIADDYLDACLEYAVKNMNPK